MDKETIELIVGVIGITIGVISYYAAVGRGCHCTMWDKCKECCYTDDELKDLINSDNK